MSYPGCISPVESLPVDGHSTPSYPQIATQPSWYERNKATLYDLFSVIVFPVGLTRLNFYLIGRCILSIPSVPTIKAPTLSIFTGTLQKIKKEAAEIIQKKNTTTVKGESFRYKTKDGVSIDAFQIICNEQREKDPTNQKWIVVPMEHSTWYQKEKQLTELYDIAEDYNVNILTMNYRGSDRFWSPWPSCSEDIIEDVDAGVRFLLNNRVQAENILLYGLSMGGALAIQVGAKYQKPDHLMPVLAQNTFTNFKEEGLEYLERCIRAHGNKANRSQPLGDFLFSIPELLFRVTYFSLSMIENFITLHPLNALSDLKDIGKAILFDTILTITGFVGTVFSLIRFKPGYEKIVNLNICLNDQIATKNQSRETQGTSLFNALARSPRLKNILSFFAENTGWTIENIDAYNKLKSTRLITYVNGDKMISDRVSLGKKLIENGKRSNVHVLGDKAKHLTTLFQDNPKKFREFIEKALHVTCSDPVLQERLLKRSQSAKF
jgi:hypothetical protein